MVEMEDDGLNLDVKSYTCLISAYGKQKNMSDMAADAFLNLKPDSITYSMMIYAYFVLEIIRGHFIITRRWSKVDKSQILTLTRSLGRFWM
ncbi:hypothetical protein K1719_036566 [Acacia pycnantha]|nr:hypothetical protein K1719_036566 [Acacia pycnantha]